MAEWQTRKTKDLVIAFRSWKFESSRPHMIKKAINDFLFFLLGDRCIMANKKINTIAILSVFVAIVMLQTFIPCLGYIRFLPALPAITTLPLTVTVFGILMGPKMGGFLGFFWGALSLFRAYTQPADLVSIMLFQNAVIAIIPRFLAGVVPGLVGKLWQQRHSTRNYLISVAAGVASTLTNTLMVILFTSIFYNHSSKLMSCLGYTDTSKSLIIVLLIALSFNSACEAIFTGILTPLIVVPLKKVLSKRL